MRVLVIDFIIMSLNMDVLIFLRLHHGSKRLTMMAWDISRDQLEAIFRVTLFAILTKSLNLTLLA